MGYFEEVYIYGGEGECFEEIWVLLFRGERNLGRLYRFILLFFIKFYIMENNEVLECIFI